MIKAISSVKANDLYKYLICDQKQKLIYCITDSQNKTEIEKNLKEKLFLDKKDYQLKIIANLTLKEELFLIWPQIIKNFESYFSFSTNWLKRAQLFLEDQELKMDLLNDEKEKAEHTMLLDLGRNDLSRIAAPGSVEVTELMEVEFYSKVMHIVSQVEADLKDGLDSLDVLKAVFPAGTVSGAPKIKAIELIDGLEKEARGVYAGTVAYLSFNGNLDSCITIRTFSLVGGRLNLQVGAGIVADSNPIKEYQETLNKGRALFDALEVVREDGIRDFSN